MKDRPILFSAPMVRALLDGSKTQTRRVVKPKAAEDLEWFGGKDGADDDRKTNEILCQRSVEDGLQIWNFDYPEEGSVVIVFPYGQPGDRLWVREAWKAHTTFDNLPPRDIPQTHVWYMADKGYKAESRHRQGMFMPRWASRITLEITSVRVERLQDISAADAQAEGIVPDGDGGWHLADTRHYMGDPISSYASLWEYINGPDSWEANPWVWVIEFKVVTP